MWIPPVYIQSSGLLDAPPDFPWKGKAQHFGPTQGTKVHTALEKVATCGLTTLTALSAEWLLYRLRPSIELDRYLHYIDATLAWEIDGRYRDQSSLQGAIPKDTPVNQALGDGIWMVRRTTEDKYQTERPDSDIYSAASLVSIIKQVLPTKPKKAFTEWFQWAAQRATELDPEPRGRKPKYTEFDTLEEFYRTVRPYFGKPLPREALDPDSGYKPEERQARLAALLQRLDHRKNPFLRSPEQMKALGFAGTPYRLE